MFQKILGKVNTAVLKVYVVMTLLFGSFVEKAYSVRSPGDVRPEDFGFTPTSRGLGDTGRNILEEVGFVIVAAFLILGTFLLGTGLMRSAKGDQNPDSRGAFMRIAIGSALIVFGVVIGIIIRTMRESAGGF